MDYGPFIDGLPKKKAILQFAKVKYGYYYGINYGSNYGVTNEKPIVHSNTHTNT